MFRRYFYPLAYSFRKLYWKTLRPRTHGVKVVLERNNQWLLIRHGYGKQHWTFPGGGVKRHETPEQAAAREVFEEVGIKLGRPISLGSFTATIGSRRDTISVFAQQVQSDQVKLRPYEIAEAQWFNKEELPKDLSESAKRVLNLYRVRQSDPGDS